MDENGKVVQNKLTNGSRLSQQGIDYDETFAPVVRLESICVLLAYASFKRFKLFQMDVKSVFLNGFIKEEIFLKQPPGFENSSCPNFVYKLSKALNGIKHAPKAWYERLSAFLLQSNYRRGKIYTTLFIQRSSSYIIMVQIYVDDIIFGSSNSSS